MTQQVELQPVHLAFAFDVSASMGNNHEAWHSRELKWEPVVRATRGFFTAQSSTGLFASLPVFPGPERSRICTANSYAEPDVPMTPLPSPLFSQAIDDVTPVTPASVRIS